MLEAPERDGSSFLSGTIHLCRRSDVEGHSPALGSFGLLSNLVLGGISSFFPVGSQFAGRFLGMTGYAGGLIVSAGQISVRTPGLRLFKRSLRART